MSFNNRGGGSNFGGRNDRGGRGGRGGGRFRGNDRGGGGKTDMTKLCHFFIKGTCTRGDSCGFSHAVSVAQNIKAHDMPVKAIGLLTRPDGVKIITGSSDKHIKVWNANTWANEGGFDTNGEVQHIEIIDNFLFWSMDVALQESMPDPVGQVHMMNINDQQRVWCQRSETLPYTHPMQIKAFAVSVVAPGEMGVITAGGEGLIRTWAYNQASNTFVPASVLEGHTRGVTCLLVQGNILWSGSMDRTLRVWDMSTGNCMGVITSAQQGHTEPITCLDSIMHDNKSYVLSGSMDQHVKIWDNTGSNAFSACLDGVITALKGCADVAGTPFVVIGLVDGSMLLQSWPSMTLICSIKDSAILHSRPVWSIISCGPGYFATSGDDGKLIVWGSTTSFAENGAAY